MRRRISETQREDLTGDPPNSSNPYAALQRACDGMDSPLRTGCALLFSAVCYVLVISTSWRSSPDAALYLGLGESLARGSGYAFNGELHTFVPPGYPVMVAAAARVFGANFLTYRVLAALTGFLAALAGYLLVRRTSGRDAAFFAGILFALNHALLANSALTLADVPFALFTLLALHGVVSAARAPDSRATLLAAGLLCAVPPLIRVNGVGVIPSALFYLACAPPKVSRRLLFVRLVVFAVIASAPPVLWEYFKSGFPPSSEEGTYSGMILGRNLGYQASLMLKAAFDYLHETTYALSGLSIRTGFIEAVLPAIVVWGAVLAWKRGDRLFAPLTAIQFAGLLLSPAGDRYLLFLLPGLYLFLGLGLSDLTEWFGRRYHGFPRPRTVALAALILLIIANTAHNMGTLWETRRSAEPYAAQTSRDEPFFKAAGVIRNQGSDVTVLTSHARILHYLSGAKTVSLVRSGVPDQHAFVEDRRMIRDMLEKTRPTFLFLDTKQSAIYASTLQAAMDAGLHLRQVGEGSSPPRFFLFAAVKE
jgi:hypothetical protein